MNYSSFFQGVVKTYGLVSRYALNGASFFPVQLFAEVTYRCNLRCGFCQFHDAGPSSGQEEIGIGEFARILNQARKGSVISFSGGEPFLKPGFLGLLEQVSKHHRTHVFTNGTLINQDTAARLVALGAKSLFDRGLVLMGISLEGREETHNRMVQNPVAFQKTLAAVASLVKEKRAKRKRYPLVEIKAVISAENTGDIYPLFSLAKAAGADLFNPMAMSTQPHGERISGSFCSPFTSPPEVPDVDTTELKKQLTRIRREANGIQVRTTPQGIPFHELLGYYENRFALKDYTCFFPWYGATVTAHGDVIICPYMKVGHVSEGSLKELLNRQEARAFRRKLRKHQNFPGCLGCCFLTRKRASIPSFS